MSRVAVLLSYYNGYKYIDEQLESIIKQNYNNIDVYIRDDGSTCRLSLEKLKEIKKNNPNIKIKHGENVGVVNSFILLLKTVSEYDFYAFCDQDDYWLPDKLYSAVSCFDSLSPFLYCSSYTLVDDKLLPMNKENNTVVPTFENALFKNFCTGCTCVINDSLRDVIIKNEIKHNIPMHDWYFLLVAYYVGQVYYDNNSYIKYRQHDSNVVGGVVSTKDKMSRFTKNIFTNSEVRSNLQRQLLELDGFDNKKEIVKDLIDSRSDFLLRVQLMSKFNFTYKKVIDNLTAYIVMFLGRY